MSIKEVEGIIISETKYSESSKILNIFTKELGLIGVISKGCLNLKSKLRSISGKLIYANFNIYYKEKGLSTLINGDVINSFKSIKKDINKISFIYYILELTNQVVKQEKDDSIYDILISCILKIEEGYDPAVITNILELKMLDFLGIRPVIDECVICGGKSNIITISGDKGGYICTRCKTNEYVVSEETIKLVRMFYYVDINKITKLNIEEKYKKEIEIFVSNYYNKYTGLYLKSKKFIENLKKLGV